MHLHLPSTALAVRRTTLAASGLWCFQLRAALLVVLSTTLGSQTCTLTCWFLFASLYGEGHIATLFLLSHAWMMACTTTPVVRFPQSFGTTRTVVRLSDVFALC